MARVLYEPLVLAELSQMRRKPRLVPLFASSNQVKTFASNEARSDESTLAYPCSALLPPYQHSNHAITHRACRIRPLPSLSGRPGRPALGLVSDVSLADAPFSPGVSHVTVNHAISCKSCSLWLNTFGWRSESQKSLVVMIVRPVRRACDREIFRPSGPLGDLRVPRT